jgi:hypothetical protein
MNYLKGDVTGLIGGEIGHTQLVEVFLEVNDVNEPL